MTISVMAAAAAGIPSGARITVSYAAIGLALVVPAALHAAILNRRHSGWLPAALAAFVLALVARQSDLAAGAAGWPMGSHFLWHLFGGAATFCVFGYLHAVRAGNGNADCADC
jgi:hemolysin III